MPEGTDPGSSGGSGNSRRAISPFFSLPNEDGLAQGVESDGHPYPPTTLSCGKCERIVGDSSAFLCATRRMGAITLTNMVSVTVGIGGLKTSMEGEWDEFCNYKNIDCAKCSNFLGKMYFATTAKLSSLQNKYTISISSVTFYHHASATPSLPIASTAEIYAQLHPSPEAVAESIDRVMTMCVMLREEQGDIIREVRKVGVSAGVDVDLGDPGEAEARESLKDKIELLDTIQQRVRDLESTIGEIVAFNNRTEAMASKLLKHSSYEIISEREVGGQKVGSLKPPSLQSNKRKRKSAQGFPLSEPLKDVVDLSRDPPGRPPFPPKPKQEIPNSQSADEIEIHVEARSEEGEGEDEDEDEEEDEDLRIKSPAERRRRAPPPTRRAKAVVLGHRPRK